MIYTNSRNIVFYLFDMLYSIKSFSNFSKDNNKLLKKKKKNVEYNWNYKPATIGLLIIKLLETWKTYQKKKKKKTFSLLYLSILGDLWVFL